MFGSKVINIINVSSIIFYLQTDIEYLNPNFKKEILWHTYKYFLIDHKILYLFVSNYNIFIFKHVQFLRIS